VLLFNRAAELRPVYAKADNQRDQITVDMLTIAFEIALEAEDKPARAAVWAEARRLGARPNRRSGVEHVAVDVVWPPGTISTSLRTRHAQAVRAGIELGHSADLFRGAITNGSRGKGGIKELARTGRSLGSERGAANVSAPAMTGSSADPKPQAHFKVARRVPLREQGLLYAVLTTEEVRQSLRASDLTTGDEFSLLVRITPSNGLEGVRYLGPGMPAPDGPAAG
jgi:hypothetical protein